MKGLVIKVFLWGVEIGRLMWDSRRKTSYFTFNQNVLGGAIDLTPFIAPISSPAAHLPIYGEEAKIYQKLPAFLADSLPDDWGSQLFEYWRTSQKIPNSEITPLEKLSFIGSRGMGALEFVPEYERAKGDDLVKISALVDLAGKIFLEQGTAKILPEESMTMQSLIAVGTSAGGRQPKAIVAINAETGEVRSGQIAELEGYDYHILKFGDPARSSAELEMTYYEMAVGAGIAMMPSRLLNVDGQNHFLTQRFDRKGGEKLHIQTLAALYPEGDSYDKLLFVCRMLNLPVESSEEIFRRMVFNVLSNNTDDHNKNFSFIMDKNGKWSLSPAYDITYIFNINGYLPETAHCLSVGGKTSDITLEDALSLARDNHIRQPEMIIDEVAAALRSFRQLAEKNGVRPEWIGRVESTIFRHLQEWDLLPSAVNSFSFEIDGHKIENVHIEGALRGNYHLHATIDSIARRYVIRKKTADHSAIDSIGMSNVTRDFLSGLVRKYFL